MVDDNEQRHPSVSPTVSEKQSCESNGNNENEPFSDDFKLVVDNAAEGIVIIQDDLICYFNQAAIKISGYPPEIYVRTHIGKILHPDDVAQMLDRYRSRLAGEDVPSVSEARFVRYDGSNGWMEVKSSKINWKGRPATVNFFSYITQRKQMEIALKESENKLRTTLDATPFPMVVVDLQDDKIIFWSRSALTLFGHTAPTASEWYQIAYPDRDYRNEVIERWKPFLEIARESGLPVNSGGI